MHLRASWSHIYIYIYTNIYVYIPYTGVFRGLMVNPNACAAKLTHHTYVATHMKYMYIYVNVYIYTMCTCIQLRLRVHGLGCVYRKNGTSHIYCRTYEIFIYEIFIYVTACAMCIYIQAHLRASCSTDWDAYIAKMELLRIWVRGMTGSWMARARY